MKLILLGAPGAGKGTQAEILSGLYNIPIIGTGNIIREAIKSGSPEGEEFKSYTDKGLLVPDELVCRMVAERLRHDDCKKGFILDGFPRNINQAEEFSKMVDSVDAVLNFVVTDDDVIKRMTGRRVCASCGTPYHLESKPPKTPGVCDLCGDKLIQRKDDAPDTVLERLKVYHAETEPLSDYYRERGLCTEIDAVGSVEEITNKAKAALEKLL